MSQLGVAAEEEMGRHDITRPKVSPIEETKYW